MVPVKDDWNDDNGLTDYESVDGNVIHHHIINKDNGNVNNKNQFDSENSFADYRKEYKSQASSNASHDANGQADKDKEVYNVNNKNINIDDIENEKVSAKTTLLIKAIKSSTKAIATRNSHPKTLLRIPTKGMLTLSAIYSSHKPRRKRTQGPQDRH